MAGEGSVSLKEKKIVTEPHLKEFKISQETENNIGMEFPDPQTEQSNESNEHIYDMDDSSDEDSDQEMKMVFHYL